MNKHDDKMIKAIARPQIIFLVVILICALLIRLYGLSDASLWLDETVTIYLSELPLSTLWVTAYDPTPPLFYTFEKIALLFGDTEFILRFPSVVFGVSTIYFVYRAALETAGHNAALAASAFLTFSSVNIEYSQEARAYALLGLCISGAFLGLVRLNAYLESARSNISASNFLKNGGGLYLLFTIAALYTHNIAAFFVFAAQVYFVLLWLYISGRNPKVAALWIVTNALIFILWLPWLAASVDIMGGDSFTWLQHMPPDKAFKTIRGVHGYPGKRMGQPFLDLFIAVMTVAGFYALKKQPGLLVLSLAALISSSLVIWLFGFYKPVFMFRTILWGSLITAFVVGIGVAQFTPRFSGGIILILALLGMKSTHSYFVSNRAEQENWKEAASYLDAEVQARDTYIFCADYVIAPFVYYANNLPDNRNIYGYDKRTNNIKREALQVNNGKTRVSWENDIVAMSEAISGERLWLISSHCKDGNIDYAKLLTQMIREAGYVKMDYKKYRNSVRKQLTTMIEIYGFQKTVR